MKKIISHSLEETRKIADEWLRDVSNRYAEPGESDKAKAVVVGLSGHLGAGKTAFVKAVAAELGVNEEVTSPTFVIMKIYELQGRKAREDVSGLERFHRLVHIDAYRLEDAQELEALRWEDLVADKHNLIMVEWPENVKLVAPEKINFRLLEENTVEIEM